MGSETGSASATAQTALKPPATHERRHTHAARPERHCLDYLFSLYHIALHIIYNCVPVPQLHDARVVLSRDWGRNDDGELGE